MMIDVVDDQDRPIGQIHRSEVFDQNASFRVAHVWIFNRSGALLVQRLAAERDRHPLQWGSSVASYVPAGQSYKDAAKDRLAAELGIEDLSLSQLAKAVMVDNGCRKFISVFAATYDGPLRIDQSHISEVRFVDIHDLISMATSRSFTPTFVHIFREILWTPLDETS